MTDLVEEIKSSFDKTLSEHAADGASPIKVIEPGDAEIVPGFLAMREHYQRQMVRITRRGYRQFAGSTMPSQADELLERTTPVMMPLLLAVQLSAFTDGVMIGHRDDQIVKMSFHYQEVDELFGNKRFREASGLMAQGLSDDPEVFEYFREYVSGGVANLGHMSGFIHREVEPGKVWDFWLLVGNACFSAVYLAGYKLGTTWRERDVLDGIELASEEGSDGPG